MWKTAHTSVVGTSHIDSGKPCEDVCLVRTAIRDEKEFLFVAIADGAGSAEHAREGAEIATATWVDEAERGVDRADGICEETLHRLADMCYTRMAEHAEAAGGEVGDYACTLLGAVIGPSNSAFFQVGDGAWVSQAGGEVHALTWPFHSEVAGEVVFITSHGRGAHYQTRIVKTPDAIAGITDGLERLALDLAEKSPLPGFFRPMWERIREREDLAAVEGELSSFLRSARVTDRTDDDKTVFLTVRVDNAVG